MASQWASIHNDGEVPDTSKDFQITCKPNTDVWEKPPATHSFNAPIVYTTTTKSNFKSARITVSGDWKDKYDQGGLALILNLSNGSRKWVKSGIEFLNDEAHVSVVGTDRWSDWSLRPTVKGSTSATIEIEDHPDGTLWVYLVDGEKKLPMREIAWWGDLDASTECLIGPYAAKPAKVQDSLVVSFKDLKIVA